jgi:DNA ligase-associated metallophosphoesterase
MKPPVPFTIAGEQLWLSPMKAIFWESRRALVVSDLHFGKTGHFRKAGIAIPQTVYKEDLQRLFSLVQFFQPQTLLVVGDFFHSTLNKEAELFARWRHDHDHLKIALIRGNHDILDNAWYDAQTITVHEHTYSDGPFCFIHESPQEAATAPGQYIFSGHLHPGVRINGAGRQSLRLPCFYFDEDFAILPAFGGFTGLATIEPSRKSSVFAIANQEILHLQ